MKRLFLSSAILFLLVLNTVAQQRKLHVTEMPKEVLTFISKHFPEDGILKSFEDKDGDNVTYEVVLDNEIELEFNSKGEIVEVDGKTNLPDSVVPSKLLEYVQKNYTENAIAGWKLKKDHQEIELNNDLDLKFTLDGDFIQTDK